MKRYPQYLIVAALFLVAACSDSNPLATTDEAAPTLRSAPVAEPGFLATDGLPELVAKRKDKQVVCHFPGGSDAPRKIEVGAGGGAAHMSHPGDGFTGEGFSDPGSHVLYDLDCQPLPEPPACPCWNDYATWSMLASTAWNPPTQSARLAILRGAESRAHATGSASLQNGRCAFTVGGTRVSLGQLGGHVGGMCQADVAGGFSETHQ